MKIIKRIGMLTLTMLFLTNGLTYAQNSDLRPIYGGKSKNVKTISVYNKAIKKNPKDAKAYYNRGLTYQTKGQYDKAISDYNVAIKINPKFTEAYINRGLIYDNNGQYDMAVRDYNMTIKIVPKHALAYTNRGISYFMHLGNIDKGCADLKKACELGMCENYNIVKQNGDCP